MKKTITFLSRRAAMLLLAMMLTTATAWAQTTITPTTPSQDGDGNYLIGNAAELYGFADLVNNGNASANAKLTADIVVNENVLAANGDANTGNFVQWTPIGNDCYNDKVYSGTFDGQRHTISGLYVSGSGWYVGLIGTAGGSAVVKNLGIVDSYFNSSNNFLGSIVGGVAEKSSVTIANVYSTSTVKGGNWIGGLVGSDGTGSVTIINSYFAGKTSASWGYGTHHDDLVSGDFDNSTPTVCNAFVLGTSLYGTSVTAAQLSDGTVAAALHYYQDALADGSMFGLSGGKTNFSGTIDGVSVTTANITLHTFDGDATAYSSKYIVGNTTPLPVMVEREGYTFFGWYDNADLEGDAVTSISSSATGNKEYWAKFERSHAVSFVLGGGTIRSGEIDHYIEGETTALPTFVTKNGASFEGWYTTEDFTGDRYYSIPATATEDMTFYAKWGAEKTTFYLRQGSETVNILYEGENIVWLDETTERFMIFNNEHKYWGSGNTITVPYVGGVYAFSNSGNKFRVAQSGFYVFTLTDKGEGNWFVSVLKSMLNCDVASIPTQVYTGSAIEPAVTVKDGETTLTLGTDYEVAYSNNVNAGTATVTITGKGNYSGETAATFTIVNPVTTSYVDATGTLHENVEAVPLDNTMTTLPAGWYVVNSTFTYDHTLTFEAGDVHIILEDGCEMNIGTSSSRVGAGIVNSSGSEWKGVTYIYGQTEGTGTMNIYTEAVTYGIESRAGYVQNGGRVIISSAEACIWSDGGVTLNGGTLSLDTPDLSGRKYGIQVGGGFTMNDGVLTASTIGESFYCTNSAFKILGGKATVNSGAIFAQRSSTLGYKNNDDYIIVKSGFTCYLSIADGQAMTDGTTVYSGTIADPSALINKTLRYCYTITYNGIEGATFTTANPEAYTRESEAITLNNPSKDGYEFAGWTGTGLDAASTSVTIAKGSTGNRTYTATWTKNIVTLDEATDNGAAITTAAQSGKIYEVTLNGRTLYKDGDWNTLCLPFAVTDFTGTPLEGATVKELLTTSNLDNTGKLTLNFSDDLTAIEAGKPYIVKWTPNLTISSASDWDAFATAVSGGTTYEGQIVKLAADISVSTMVGAVSGTEQQKAFQGTFDGGGHTITVSISNTSDQGTAPFRFIKNATIKNVKTTGTVTGGMHCAGLVGFAQGTNTIQNCHVDVAVTGSGSNHSHLGGVLGHGLSSTTTITDCLFSGSISNAGTATGIIYGWADNGTHTIVNCLAAGTYTSCNDIDMMKGSDTQTATNCYKNVSGGSKGTQTDATGDALVALLGAGWVNNSGNVVPKMNPNIVSPVFGGVTIVKTAPAPVNFSGGSFVGNYNPFAITDANRKSIVLLAAGNKLGYAKTDRTLGAFRAYFDIPSVAGAPAISSYELNFGEDDDENTTGIIEVNTNNTNLTNKAEGVFDLQGRKVANPSKGLYIVNGRKVIIK